MKTILVTGGNGFLGRALCEFLANLNFQVKATIKDRRKLKNLPADVEGVVTGDLELLSDWHPLLIGVDTVIHLAGRAHQCDQADARSESLYRKTNEDVSRKLADSCVKAGVRKLIFFSSVKAMGERTAPGEAWTESSICVPQDPYGRSKLAAEHFLYQIAAQTNKLQIVILRLPLVYGPGVKANFLRLFKIVDKGVPLPLAGIKNSRSFIYIGNLLDAVLNCMTHPHAAGKLFLISDGEDVSTPELIRGIGRAIGRPPRLFLFPPTLIRLGGKAFGQSDTTDRLLSSLCVDTRKIRQELSWKPPYTVEQGLALTAEWYLETKERR